MTVADLSTWIPLMLLGFLGSAYFSGVETGVHAQPRAAAPARCAEGAGGGPPAPAGGRPARLLAVLLVGDNAANYLGTFALAVLLEAAGISGWWAILLNVGLVTPMLFVFGETLPKDLFAAHGDRLLYRLSGSIRVFERLFSLTGGVPLVNVFGRLALRLVGEGPGRGGRRREGSGPSAIRAGRCRRWCARAWARASSPASRATCSNTSSAPRAGHRRRGHALGRRHHRRPRRHRCGAPASGAADPPVAPADRRRRRPGHRLGRPLRGPADDPAGREARRAPPQRPLPRPDGPEYAAVEQSRAPLDDRGRRRRRAPLGVVTMRISSTAGRGVVRW